jgi:hypothetical protein
MKLLLLIPPRVLLGRVLSLVLKVFSSTIILVRLDLFLKLGYNYNECHI